MAEIFVTQFSNRAGQLVTRLRGPAWLGDSGKAPDSFRKYLAPRVSALGKAFKAAAASAYQDTRFENSFRVATNVSDKARITKISLTNTNPIFGYVENPTRPHRIQATHSDFLVFYWQRIGRVVFMPRVHHPGTKGKLYLARLSQQYAELFRAEIESAMRQALSE